MTDPHLSDATRVPNAGHPRPAGNARLPWTLVAILTVAVVALSSMVITRDAELAGLKTVAGSATARASASPSTSKDAAVVQLLTSLPRRQAGDPTALGRVDAPVVLVEWSDYRCPYCAVWTNRTLPELLPYVDSGSLRIEFRDLAIFGGESVLAAVGARAAGMQGKFWEFHRALFAAAPPSGGHPTITQTEVLAFAKAAGVGDLARFQADLADPALTQAVQADTQQAQNLRITGTPFFVINTEVISGAQPTATFTALIERLGAKK